MCVGCYFIKSFDREQLSIGTTFIVNKVWIGTFVYISQVPPPVPTKQWYTDADTDADRSISYIMESLWAKEQIQCSQRIILQELVLYV